MGLDIHIYIYCFANFAKLIFFGEAKPRARAISLEYEKLLTVKTSLQHLTRNTISHIFFIFNAKPVNSNYPSVQHAAKTLSMRNDELFTFIYIHQLTQTMRFHILQAPPFKGNFIANRYSLLLPLFVIDGLDQSSQKQAEVVKNCRSLVTKTRKTYFQIPNNTTIIIEQSRKSNKWLYINFW